MIIESEILGYISLIFCAVQLLYGLFIAHDPMRSMIYGIGLFAAVVIALNIGGILNDYTWGIFGIGMFGLNVLYYMKKGPAYAVVIYSMLLAASALTL